MEYTTKRYGWIPDTPDPRDHLYRASQVMFNLPGKVDLRPQMPYPPLQQADIGSCTAHAIAAAFRFNQRKQGATEFDPSRLFIYYEERAILGLVDEDSGALLRDGIKVVSKVGCPPEDMWPYNIAKFKEKPPQEVYDSALKNQVVLYQRIPRDIQQMKQCLASGFPFVFGFTVYPQFETMEVARTGMVPMPNPNDPLRGGHAVLAVGYDDEKQVITFRNSWGPGWGDVGYGYLPYGYFIDRKLSADFWTIRFVEDGK